MNAFHLNYVFRKGNRPIKFFSSSSRVWVIFFFEKKNKGKANSIVRFFLVLFTLFFFHFVSLSLYFFREKKKSLIETWLKLNSMMPSFRCHRRWSNTSVCDDTFMCTRSTRESVKNIRQKKLNATAFFSLSHEFHTHKRRRQCHLYRMGTKWKKKIVRTLSFLINVLL